MVGCLPPSADIFFYTISVEFVTEIPESGGLALWDRRIRIGLPVSAGIDFLLGVKPPKRFYSGGSFRLLDSSKSFSTKVLNKYFSPPLNSLKVG
jgi:hypothetical protein